MGYYSIVVWLSWKSSGLLSGKPWVQTPPGPSAQFRWSRHWAVTLSHWPCLLHPYTSVGRWRKRMRDIVRKEWGTCAVIGLGGRDDIKHGLKQQHSTP